jgi:sugar/nucleoside kinase (ribokinase family)
VLSPRTHDLLVLAELNPDVVVGCGDGGVQFGQVEQLVDAATLTLGSSGALTASAAAAQGLRVALIAVVGDDAAGALSVELLAAQGVDVSGVIVRPGERTGMTVVLCTPDGDRAMLTFPGTMTQLRASDVHGLDTARHVHVSSFYLQKALQVALPSIFADCRDAGTTTSLDPGWDPEQRWASISAALTRVDHLLPNAAECQAIARAVDAHGEVGDDAEEEAAVLAAARLLHRMGPSVAVKQGGDGALLVTSGQPHRLVTTPVVPVDTTGAGDSFNAGYIAGLLDGQSPIDALPRAVASGTIAVGGWGGTGRLASSEEALRAAGQLHVHSLPDRATHTRADRSNEEAP